MYLYLSNTNNLEMHEYFSIKKIKLIYLVLLSLSGKFYVLKL
jgi:hypothetical protein